MRPPPIGLNYFLFTEPWVTVKEERRVRHLLEQAYEQIENTTDARRQGAYRVIRSANAVSVVVLPMN